MNKVLITGASSGIGKELAHCFAKDQHHLIITARSEKELLALKEELEKKYSITVDLFPTDLSQIENVQKLTRWVAENGWSITHLINNAGFGDVGLFEYTQWTKNQQMIELNITALTALCHHYVPLMKENGFGRILNVASTAAFQPGPTMAVYFATKSYVLHFSEALNGELKGSGISVTALCPGPTQTQFAKAAGFNDNGIFDSTKKFPSAKEVAEFGYQSLLKQKSVAIHGLKNYVLANTSRIFPRDMVVAVAKWMMKG
jgi:short-subunit dehydrogenase